MIRQKSIWSRIRAVFLSICVITMITIFSQDVQAATGKVLVITKANKSSNNSYVSSIYWDGSEESNITLGINSGLNYTYYKHLSRIDPSSKTTVGVLGHYSSFVNDTTSFGSAYFPYSLVKSILESKGEVTLSIQIPYVCYEDERQTEVRYWGADMITVSLQLKETNPPTVKMSKSTANWSKSLLITTTVEDESDLSDTTFNNISEGPVWVIEKTVTKNGVYKATAKDKYGNVGQGSITITNIDSEKPVLTCTIS